MLLSKYHPRDVVVEACRALHEYIGRIVRYTILSMPKGHGLRIGVVYRETLRSQLDRGRERRYTLFELRERKDEIQSIDCSRTSEITDEDARFGEARAFNGRNS